jgi:hypothetical protein
MSILVPRQLYLKCQVSITIANCVLVPSPSPGLGRDAFLRSLVPSRPARCHQNLAYGSPPFHCVYIYSVAHDNPRPPGLGVTTWETGDLFLDVPPSPIRAVALGSRTQSLMATGQVRHPAVPGEHAHPPDRRSREMAGPVRAVPGHNILPRARSWDRHLGAPFRQIAACHSPPSTISHRPDASLRPSTPAE